MENGEEFSSDSSDEDYVPTGKSFEPPPLISPHDSTVYTVLGKDGTGGKI